MASALTTTAAAARPAAPTPPRAAPATGRLTSRAAPAAGSAKRVAKPLAAVQQQAAVNYEALAADMDLKSPLEIMDFALATFGPDIAIAFSGAEDVALIEYAHLTGRPYRVFSLDTGRLNPETYRLFDAVEKHYKIKIEYTFPDAQETMDFVREKGMFSFYEDGHGECCRVRKVRPLRRQLTTLKAWVTGQRKDQSPGTRMTVPVVQVDPVFEGVTGGPGSLIKFNPLSNATSAQVWGFLRVMGVPVNALHSCGYVSIGCEPCTRAVLPGQHEREGRWWWEDAAAKECGLHSGNIVDSAADQAAKEGAPDLWGPGSAVQAVSKADLEALLATSGTRKGPATLVALYAPWCQFCQGLEPAYEELARNMGGSKAVRVVKLRADEADVRPWAEATFGLKTFPTLALIPSVGKPVKYGSDDRSVEMLENWAGAVAGFE